MSIEAMKLALAALETCRIRSVSEWEVSDVTPKNVTAAISALRTALQQAKESEPVTVESVATVRRGKLSWLIEGGVAALPDGVVLLIADSQITDNSGSGEVYTHPAPGVPADVMLDRYDAGILNDFGGGNVEWWQDYIRAELGHAHDFYQSQIDAAKDAT